MLLCLPRKYHSEDDDYAPVDYQYVGSVAEGERLRQAEAIHRGPAQAAVRHRVDPNAEGGGEAPAAAQPVADGARGLEAARRMPRAGDPAPAASVAYPRPRDNAFAQTPTYAPQSAPPPLSDAPREDTRGRRARYMGAQPEYADAPAQAAAPDLDGQRQAAPSQADMPDWLRIARQNNMPLYDERRVSARGTAAPAAPAAPATPPPVDLLGRPMARTAPPRSANPTPMTAEEYAAAGYPPELIAQKMNEDAALRAAMGVGRKRHGAQLAAPPDRRQAQPQGMTYAPRASHDMQDGGLQDPYAQPPQAYGYPAPSGPVAYEGNRRRTPGGYEAEPMPGENRLNQPAGQDFAPRAGYTVYTEGAADAPGGAARHRRSPYPVPQREDEWPEDEPDEPDKPRLRVPYLGIATFAAALALVLLWILRLTYTAQTGTVLASREAAQARYLSNYPYSYRELIEREAAQNNLHPAFVAAIVLNESSFNPKAESNVGARGLMQMMPDTAEWVHGKIGDTMDYSFDLMYDADTNVRYACWYLSYLSGIFRGDPVLVSAAFHAGQTTVQNWLNDSRYSADSTSIELSKMAEGPTKTYATRVLKAYAVYRRLYYEGGQVTSPTAIDNAPGTPAA